MLTNETLTATPIANQTGFDAVLIFDEPLTQQDRDDIAEVIQFQNEIELYMFDYQAHVYLVTVLSHIDDRHSWGCSPMLHVHFPSAELARHQLFHARLAVGNLLRAYRYDEELISTELAEIALLVGSSNGSSNAALHFRDTVLRIAINLPGLLDSGASSTLMDAANALSNSIIDNDSHLVDGINSVLNKLSIK